MTSPPGSPSKTRSTRLHERLQRAKVHRQWAQKTSADSSSGTTATASTSYSNHNTPPRTNTTSSASSPKSTSNERLSQKRNRVMNRRKMTVSPSSRDYESNLTTGEKNMQQPKPGVRTNTRPAAGKAGPPQNEPEIEQTVRTTPHQVRKVQEKTQQQNQQMEYATTPPIQERSIMDIEELSPVTMDTEVRSEQLKTQEPIVRRWVPAQDEPLPIEIKVPEHPPKERWQVQTKAAPPLVTKAPWERAKDQVNLKPRQEQLASWRTPPGSKDSGVERTSVRQLQKDQPRQTPQNVSREVPVPQIQDQEGSQEKLLWLKSSGNMREAPRPKSPWQKHKDQLRKTPGNIPSSQLGPESQYEETSREHATWEKPPTHEEVPRPKLPWQKHKEQLKQTSGEISTKRFETRPEEEHQALWQKSSSDSDGVQHTLRPKSPWQKHREQLRKTPGKVSKDQLERESDPQQKKIQEVWQRSTGIAQGMSRQKSPWQKHKEQMERTSIERSKGLSEPGQQKEEQQRLCSGVSQEITKNKLPWSQNNGQVGQALSKITKDESVVAESHKQERQQPFDGQDLSIGAEKSSKTTPPWQNQQLRQTLAQPRPNSPWQKRETMEKETLVTDARAEHAQPMPEYKSQTGRVASWARQKQQKQNENIEFNSQQEAKSPSPWRNSQGVKDITSRPKPSWHASDEPQHTDGEEETSAQKSTWSKTRPIVASDHNQGLSSTDITEDGQPMIGPNSAGGKLAPWQIECLSRQNRSMNKGKTEPQSVKSRLAPWQRQLRQSQGMAGGEEASVESESTEKSEKAQFEHRPQQKERNSLSYSTKPWQSQKAPNSQSSNGVVRRVQSVKASTTKKLAPWEKNREEQEEKKDSEDLQATSLNQRVQRNPEGYNSTAGHFIGKHVTKRTEIIDSQRVFGGTTLESEPSEERKLAPWQRQRRQSAIDDESLASATGMSSEQAKWQNHQSDSGEVKPPLSKVWPTKAANWQKQRGQIVASPAPQEDLEQTPLPQRRNLSEPEFQDKLPPWKRGRDNIPSSSKVSTSWQRSQSADPIGRDQAALSSSESPSWQRRNDSASPSWLQNNQSINQDKPDISDQEAARSNRGCPEDKEQIETSTTTATRNPASWQKGKSVSNMAVPKVGRPTPAWLKSKTTSSGKNDDNNIIPSVEGSMTPDEETIRTPQKADWSQVIQRGRNHSPVDPDGVAADEAATKCDSRAPSPLKSFPPWMARQAPSNDSADGSNQLRKSSPPKASSVRSQSPRNCRLAPWQKSNAQDEHDNLSENAEKPRNCSTGIMGEAKFGSTQRKWGSKARLQMPFAADAQGSDIDEGQTVSGSAVLNPNHEPAQPVGDDPVGGKKDFPPGGLDKQVEAPHSLERFNIIKADDITPVSMENTNAEVDAQLAPWQRELKMRNKAGGRLSIPRRAGVEPPAWMKSSVTKDDVTPLSSQNEEKKSNHYVTGTAILARKEMVDVQEGGENITAASTGLAQDPSSPTVTNLRPSLGLSSATSCSFSPPAETKPNTSGDNTSPRSKLSPSTSLEANGRGHNVLNGDSVNKLDSFLKRGPEISSRSIAEDSSSRFSVASAAKQGMDELPPTTLDGFPVMKVLDHGIDFSRNDFASASVASTESAASHTSPPKSLAELAADTVFITDYNQLMNTNDYTLEADSVGGSEHENGQQSTPSKANLPIEFHSILSQNPSVDSATSSLGFENNPSPTKSPETHLKGLRIRERNDTLHSEGSSRRSSPSGSIPKLRPCPSDENTQSRAVSRKSEQQSQSSLVVGADTPQEPLPQNERESSTSSRRSPTISFAVYDKIRNITLEPPVLSESEPQDRHPVSARHKSERKVSTYSSSPVRDTPLKQTSSLESILRDETSPRDGQSKSVRFSLETGGIEFPADQEQTFADPPDVLPMSSSERGSGSDTASFSKYSDASLAGARADRSTQRSPEESSARVGNAEGASVILNYFSTETETDFSGAEQSRWADKDPDDLVLMRESSPSPDPPQHGFDVKTSRGLSGQNQEHPLGKTYPLQRSSPQSPPSCLTRRSPNSTSCRESSFGPRRNGTAAPGSRSVRARSYEPSDRNRGNARAFFLSHDADHAQDPSPSATHNAFADNDSAYAMDMSVLESPHSTYYGETQLASPLSHNSPNPPGWRRNEDGRFEV